MLCFCTSTVLCLCKKLIARRRKNSLKNSSDKRSTQGAILFTNSPTTRQRSHKFYDFENCLPTRVFGFYEAAEAMNLIADDREWTKCLENARETEIPCAMRLFFANICANCGPSDPLLLWQTFREHERRYSSPV
jgi:hypothetical protein